jgi:hypothetical protein
MYKCMLCLIVFLLGSYCKIFTVKALVGFRILESIASAHHLSTGSLQGGKFLITGPTKYFLYFSCDYSQSFNINFLWFLLKKKLGLVLMDMKDDKDEMQAQLRLQDLKMNLLAKKLAGLDLSTHHLDNA